MGMAKKCTYGRVSVLLFVTLFFGGSYFFPFLHDDNSSARHFLVSAVVDDGTLSIDRFADQTIDKSFHDGHYYSVKAIGSPFLAMPVYWLLRNISFTRGDEPINDFHCRVINVATSVVCFSVLGVLIWFFCFRVSGRPLESLLVALASSFGSISWIHATLFSGHVMAAMFSFLGFVLIYWMRRSATDATGNSLQNVNSNEEELCYKKLSGAQSSMSLALASGLVVGLGALCDYTAMLLALILTVYLLVSRVRVKQKVGFLLGGCVTVVFLALYNWSCFGHPLSFSYSKFAYEEYSQGVSKGLLGITLLDPRVVLDLMISPSRGFFYIMPIFLFGLWGMVSMWKSRPDLRAEWWVIAVSVLGYFAMIGGFYGWHGGWTFGPRYLLPMLPFLVLPMVFSPVRSQLFALVFIVSCAQIALAVVCFPHTDHESLNPLRELLVPLLQGGYLSNNILSSLFGWSLRVGAMVGLLLTGLLAWLTFRTVIQECGVGNEGVLRPSRSFNFIVCGGLIGILLGWVFVETDPSTLLEIKMYYTKLLGVDLL